MGIPLAHDEKALSDGPENVVVLVVREAHMDALMFRKHRRRLRPVYVSGSMIHRQGWNRLSETPLARRSAEHVRHALHTARKRRKSTTSLERARSAISAAGPVVRLPQSLLHNVRSESDTDIFFHKHDYEKKNICAYASLI